MKSRVSLIISVACLTIFCLASSLGAKVYCYQDLSLLGLTISGTGSNPASIKAINDSAWLVGNYYNSASSNYQPFVWRPGLGRTNLQNPGDSLKASAHGINNQGQIVGQAFVSGLGFDACYWSSPAAAPVALPTTGSSMYENCAYGINEAGQVSGEGQFGFPAPTLAVLWPANHSTGTNLGTLGGTTSSGKGINSTGWVAGEADDNANPSSRHACLWIPGQQPQQIPLPSSPFSSSAKAITDHGTVLGQGQLGFGLGQAFFYDNQTGVAQYIPPDAYSSLPGGMSEADQVVGWYEIFFPNFSQGVFYWTPGGGQKNLNQMVVNLPPGVTLSSADAISRNGRYITGFDSQGHPYLLTASAYVPITMLLLD
jgi:uncharacterized membrane protein